MAYRLLEKFRSLFDGVQYKHRDSTLGDSITPFLFDDLVELGRSPKLVESVRNKTRVVNTRNRMVGKEGRRGDGTFGERLPDVPAREIEGHLVSFGSVATIDIGIEVKILAKAMIKQLDRVGTDMINQVAEFRKHKGNPICIGIVGINRATQYTSYEGDRHWPTDGGRHKHPIQEADEAERRLTDRVKSAFDELIVLRFEATNTPPYPFKWTNLTETEVVYGASLVRISRECERRW